MRLKQLLGILLLPCIATAMAAAGSQLTQVSIHSDGGATNITLHATGPFTHTEYRPTDNLLLVDLADVSTGKMDGKTHPLSASSVVSYRVLGYKSSDGSDVARVELTLASGAAVKLSDGADQVNVQVGPSGASAMHSAPAIATHAVPTAAAERIATIEKLGVVRGHDGVEIELVSTAPL